MFTSGRKHESMNFGVLDNADFKCSDLKQLLLKACILIRLWGDHMLMG